jgi:hypothetical protein
VPRRKDLTRWLGAAPIKICSNFFDMTGGIPVDSRDASAVATQGAWPAPVGLMGYFFSRFLGPTAAFLKPLIAGGFGESSGGLLP